MSKYFLARHAFACETGKHVVFLDLKRDMYSFVDPASVATLRRCVEGWPDDPTMRESSPSGSDDIEGSEVIDMLIHEGLLTTDAASGKWAAPLNLETPTGTFRAAPRFWPGLTRQHVRNFVWSWALTTFMLRTMPLSWTVNRVRRRKERDAPKAPPVDMARARQLTTVHIALQPVFYDPKDACLRDCLTLIEFLAHYQIYPTLVFGVTVNPFAAHSWLQLGSTLLLDPVIYVENYTPIMAV